MHSLPRAVAWCMAQVSAMCDRGSSPAISSHAHTRSSFAAACLLSATLLRAPPCMHRRGHTHLPAPCPPPLPQAPPFLPAPKCHQAPRSHRARTSAARQHYHAWHPATPAWQHVRARHHYACAMPHHCVRQRRCRMHVSALVTGVIHHGLSCNRAWRLIFQGAHICGHGTCPQATACMGQGLVPNHSWHAWSPKILSS